MKKIAILLFFFSNHAWGGLPPTRVQGPVDLNPVTTFVWKYTGAGVSVSHSGTTATITIPGAGTLAVWQGASGNFTGSTTSTSFANLGSATGSLTPGSNNTGISCSSAASGVGMTCTLPSIGHYIVCYSGDQFSNSVTFNQAAQLADGSGVVIVGPQTGNGNRSGIGSCGDYFASSTTESFQLQGQVGSGTVTGTYNMGSFTISSH